MTRQALAALITLWMIGAGVAEAEEQCSELLAPASTSQRATGLDQARAACGADTFGLGLRAFASTDQGSVDELLSTALFLDYRVLHTTGFEFALGARVLDYRLSREGDLVDDETFYGPIHVAVLRPNQRTWFGKPAVLSHGIRLELPYTNTADDNFTLAVSPSIMASLFVSESLHLHGRVAGLLRSILPKDAPDSQAALLSSIDLGYSPLSFASLLVGAEVQGGWYGLGLDHLQGRAGLRIATGDLGAIELSAGAAVLGDESAGLVTWLGYRRSAAPAKKPKRSRLQDWAR